ncbi:unnamed protein product [Brugia timori]|uniref:Saposin B-type domain-containing protein n=1 Tax=Brugia timori TaxID=42155 RepID=A0A0R3R0T4_9BILA|nr:unnamed protein product [Brugia timori]
MKIIAFWILPEAITLCALKSWMPTLLKPVGSDWDMCEGCFAYMPFLEITKLISCYTVCQYQKEDEKRIIIPVRACRVEPLGNSSGYIAMDGKPIIPIQHFK